MKKVNAKLLRDEEWFFHWCPACKILHALPKGWQFNNDLEKPSFNPSFKHTHWKIGICHYILTDGVLIFQSDCSHDMRGQSVPIPDLPDTVAHDDSPAKV